VLPLTVVLDVPSSNDSFATLAGLRLFAFGTVAGNLRCVLGPKRRTLTGTSAHDDFRGTNGPDVICGLGAMQHSKLLLVSAGVLLLPPSPRADAGIGSRPRASCWVGQQAIRGTNPEADRTFPDGTLRRTMNARPSEVEPMRRYLIVANRCMGPRPTALATGSAKSKYCGLVASEIQSCTTATAPACSAAASWSPPGVDGGRVTPSLHRVPVRASRAYRAVPSEQEVALTAPLATLLDVPAVHGAVVVALPADRSVEAVSVPGEDVVVAPTSAKGIAVSRARLIVQDVESRTAEQPVTALHPDEPDAAL